MDVTCERCGTEYEFDETLVSDRGTTVKCTNCGHLFKVFRPGSEPSAADTKTWTLETRDGGTQQISSLKELQRLITAGEVTSEDRISRSGEGWKRLGDIAELQTFFAAARAAEAPRSVRPPARDGAPRRDPTNPQPHQIAAPAPPPAQRPQPPGPQRGKGTMLGMGQRSAEQRPPEQRIDGSARTIEMAVPPPANPPPAAMRPQQTLKASPAPPARVEPPAHVEEPARRPPSVRPPPTRQTPSAQPERAEGESSQRITAPQQRTAPRVADARPSDRPRALRVDDDDDVPRPPTRSLAGPFLAVVILLALGVGGYFGSPVVQQMLAASPADAPGAAFLAAGDAALALDRNDAYDDAASEYTKALALDEHNPRVLTGLSRAYALIAQNHLFDALDLDARAVADPSAAGEATALRRQATSEAEDAREYAESAVRQGGGGADAEVALSDALRLSGDADHASSRLDRALTLSPEPSAEALRVRALLESAGGLAAAVDSAERAVAEDPGLIRARLLLARAQLAAGNTSSARAQVSAVLDRDADHPIALALRQQIDAAGPATEAVDAGTVAVAVVTPPPVDTAPPSTEHASTEHVSTEHASTEHADRAPSEGGSSPRGGDYDALVAQADAQLENAHPERARPLYEAALRARPGGPAAVTGLGFVLLDQRNYQAALSQFRQASTAGYGHAYIGLGSTYRQLHDFDHALEAYENYLSRLPTGPEASIARRQADLLRAQGAHSGSSPATTTPAPTSEHTTPAPAPPSDTPVTHESELPAPRGATAPPTPDVPAIESEP